MSTFDITAANKVPFRIRIVRKGEKYGLNDGLVHDHKDPLVEFFDRRYDHTPNGQFVSRYYAETILEHADTGGLLLHGGVPNWTVDRESMYQVKEFVRGEVNRAA